MKQPTIVAAGLMRQGVELLIVQRKKGSFRGLKWEFPGGKLDYGETVEDCIKRELKEELNITVEFAGVRGVNSHIYGDSGMHVVVILCECRIVSGAPTTVECNDLRWVGIADLTEYEFVEADRPFVASLLNEAGLDYRLEES